MGNRRAKALGHAAAGIATIAALCAGTSATARAATPGTSAAPAQQGFSVETFDPSVRGSQWFVLDSLDFRDDGRGAAGVVADYAYKPFVIKNPDGSDRATIVSNQLFIHPGGSLVILDRLRLSFDLPIALADTGSAGVYSGTVFAAPNEASLGDTAFALDIRMFGRYGEVFTGSIGLEALAPTGSPAQYTGDGKTRFVPRLQFAGTYDDLMWAVRLGMLFRVEDDPIAGQTRGDAFVFGGSIGWRPRSMGGKLVVGPEIYGSTSITEPAPVNAPIEALVGAHYSFAPEWRVGVGVGPGLSSGLGTPLLRTALSLEYVAQAQDDKPKKVVHHREGPADRDHDDVPDTLDACPDQPGPPSVDASINGCPPPPDTDGDGIPDTLDACPEEKGSPNADPEFNGCPPDADQDGIPDSEDACPLRAGVEQTDKKQNGCPPDSDKDGILDVDDACPGIPGAPSKDPQDNGCPYSPDRDNDGILNEDDACPREAGPKNPDPKKNGCPKAILRGSEIRILDQVRFEQNSARISKGKDTAAVLAAVAKVLIEHPEITRLEVQGHTDNKGDPKANKKLSEQRAQAVVKALVALGLGASRFTAVGYGDERPIETNATDAGRTANRRVEFHAVDTAIPGVTVPAPASPATPASEEKKPGEGKAEEKKP